jgi:hypothetical protein
MSQARRRRIARLEKLAEPTIERVRQSDEARNAGIRDAATSHAIGLGALILFGNPKEDEPLSEAWQRCMEWFQNQGLDRNTCLLISGNWIRCAAEIVREKVTAELPGSTEKEKFQNLFSSAPPWLIWFTFADFTGSILDLALPDLSSVTHFERSKSILNKWPNLPDGKFEFRIRSDDLGLEGVSVRDVDFLKDMHQIPAEKMTRLDRKRYFSLLHKLEKNWAVPQHLFGRRQGGPRIEI